MYLDVSILQKNIRGVKGAFLIKDGEILNTDMDRDMEHLSTIIFYLTDMVCRRKGTIKKLSIGTADQFFLFFKEPYVLGVAMSSDSDPLVLDIVIDGVFRLVSTMSDSDKLEFPKTLAREVPHFVRSRDDVLFNAPEYARKVLEFVDGTHTVRDIIGRSKLPPEVVLDVILTYARSSVLAF